MLNFLFSPSPVLSPSPVFGGLGGTTVTRRHYMTTSTSTTSSPGGLVVGALIGLVFGAIGGSLINKSRGMDAVTASVVVDSAELGVDKPKAAEHAEGVRCNTHMSVNTRGEPSTTVKCAATLQYTYKDRLYTQRAEVPSSDGGRKTVKIWVDRANPGVFSTSNQLILGLVVGGIGVLVVALCAYAAWDMMMGVGALVNGLAMAGSPSPSPGSSVTVVSSTPSTTSYVTTSTTTYR